MLICLNMLVVLLNTTVGTCWNGVKYKTPALRVLILVPIFPQLHPIEDTGVVNDQPIGIEFNHMICSLGCFFFSLGVWLKL